MKGGGAVAALDGGGVWRRPGVGVEVAGQPGVVVALRRDAEAVAALPVAGSAPSMID